MYTRQELEKMTVLELRKVAKTVQVKLGAGIDKAGIVEKILNGQDSAKEEPVTSSVDDHSDSFLSFDVTSAPKPMNHRPNSDDGNRMASHSKSWQNRTAPKAGFRGSAQPPVKRFGPQNRTTPQLSEEETQVNADQNPRHDTKPKENLVTSDGYRLGYRAQSQRSSYQSRDEGDPRNASNGSYRPKYSYQHRSVVPTAAENHFHNDVYEMTRNVEFDKQIMDGVQPELLSYFEGKPCSGILEIMPDGYGFVANTLQEANESVYVSPAQIKRFALSNGDHLEGQANLVKADDPYPVFLYIDIVNGKDVSSEEKKLSFENLESVYPSQRIPLEAVDRKDLFIRMMDMVTPMGYGQRTMIIAPPDSASLVAMKDIAVAINKNDPNSVVFVLLLDVPPEEIALMKKSVKAEVLAASFGDAPETQTRTCEMIFERAQKLALEGKNVVILLDSINKLVRAYQNQMYQGNRPITNAVTPAALIRPKRFYSMAKDTNEAGSLTIVASLQTETGSRIDDIIFEEFKGTANMVLTLCSPNPEDIIHPMVDIKKSSTRREELLMTDEEIAGVKTIRSMLFGETNANAVSQIVDMMKKTKSNQDLYSKLKGWMAILDSRR